MTVKSHRKSASICFMVLLRYMYFNLDNAHLWLPYDLGILKGDIQNWTCITTNNVVMNLQEI